MANGVARLYGRSSAVLWSRSAVIWLWSVVIFQKVFKRTSGLPKFAPLSRLLGFDQNLAPLQTCETFPMVSMGGGQAEGQA